MLKSLKQTLTEKWFVVKLSALMVLLLVCLLRDPNFNNGCQHVFLSATNSIAAAIHSVVMWYQSWNALQKAIPLSLVLLAIGRSLFLYAEHNMHHVPTKASRGEVSQKNKDSRKKAAVRRKSKLLAEAGLGCMILGCLNLANGLPTVLATGFCSFLAFFILQASWQRLRTAEERFEQEYQENPHARIKLGEQTEVLDSSGQWVKGEAAEFMDEQVRLEEPAPTADDPDRKTDIWVPYAKINEDNITKHTPPPRPKQTVSFQDKQAHRPSKTEPNKTDTEKTDPNQTES